MNNFEFYNPTRIIFGKETVTQLKDQIPADAKVLILYGGSSAEKTGTLDEVRSALKGYSIQEFGGIEANPEYETLMRAVEKVKAEGSNFLLAVGGGSVIDGAKFIAAAAKHKGDAWEILTTHGKAINNGALPFGTVLTLPATGSEMNSGSVVTRRAQQSKLAFSHTSVFPLFSILDPTKTYTLPIRQVANGVVDSFVHVMEQYLTYPVNAMVQDKFSESLLQILVEIGPKVISKADDYDSRANLMWVAALALNGLLRTGVPQDWASHMIGHELTALYGMDHAQTLAVVLPSVLRNQKESKREKLLQYATQVWQITSGSDDEQIEQAIAKTEQFFESLGVKTKLSDYGVKPDQIGDIVTQLKAHNMVALGEHGAIIPEVSREILVNCF